MTSASTSAMALQDLSPTHIATCFGCGRANPSGFRLRSFFNQADPSEFLCWMTPNKHHCGYPGMMNGGILATIADCHSMAAARASKMQKALPHDVAHRIAQRFGAAVTEETSEPSAAPAASSSADDDLADLNAVYARRGFSECVTGQLQIKYLRPVELKEGRRLLARARVTEWSSDERKAIVSCSIFAPGKASSSSGARQAPEQHVECCRSEVAAVFVNLSPTTTNATSTASTMATRSRL